MKTWKIIKNYNYIISSEGDVYSFYNDLKKISQETVVKGNYRYKRVSLYKNGNKRKFSVHRLVASVFLGDVKGKHVHHKDGNALNNNAENLEILEPRTHFEIHDARGFLNNNSKLNNEDVKEIYDLSLKSNYNLKEIAEKFGIASSTISNIINGRRWQHLDLKPFKRIRDYKGGYLVEYL